jgi:hypothetical protein
MRRLVTLAALMLAAVASAEQSELERLRAENARLRARVTELEAEQRRLERQQREAPLAAALEQTAAERVRAAFDPATGITTTATEPSRLARADGGLTRHWVTWRAAWPGEHPSAPPASVELVIETAASPGAYRTARRLRLTVDGVVHELPIVGYASRPITAGRSPTRVAEQERMVADVPMATLAVVADGRAVEGTLGAFAFRLTPEQLATVRAFQARVRGS